MIAISQALKVTLADIGFFFVVLPMVVGGLILFAVIQARGENRGYEETHRHTPPRE